MELLVIRKWLSVNESIGELMVNGKFFCYTLEDSVRADGVKIKDETAIPYGTYKISLTFSPKFNRVLPLIEDVPNFSGIRIHPGNTKEDTSGCLLVGYGKTDTTITDSRHAFEDLFSILSKASQEGEPITITFHYPG